MEQVPIDPSDELDDLIAAGQAIPATRSGPFTMPTVKGPAGEDAAALIRRLRDEERT